MTGQHDAPIGGAFPDDPRATDQAYQLCEALDIDPAEVTEVHIEIAAGRGAIARWTCVRHVDIERIAKALERPEPVPDPWDGVIADGSHPCEPPGGFGG